MNYQNPIEVFQTQMQSQIEDEIYKAVMKVGVNVDKDELLKALQYDRGQYQKGYADRDSEIVRCKDCKHRPVKVEPDYAFAHIKLEFPDYICPCQCDDAYYSWYPSDDWFCADGEAKDS